MPRIVIIGNSGGGKSTLAKKLAHELRLIQTEIDALLWQPNWTLGPIETFERKHEAILSESDWVIDGLGRRETIAKRIQRATHVVLIDMPLWTHYWLAAERHISLVTGKSDVGPGGFRDPPPLQSLFRTIAEVDQVWMPEIRALCALAESNEVRVIRVRDLQDLDSLPQSFAKARPDNSGLRA